MAITEKDRIEAQQLIREVLLILGDLDDIEERSSRVKNQQLIREVLLILGDLDDIEERSSRVKKRTTELYKKLDNIADGDEG